MTNCKERHFSTFVERTAESLYRMKYERTEFRVVLLLLIYVYDIVEFMHEV